MFVVLFVCLATRNRKKATFKVEGVSHDMRINGLKYHIITNYGDEVSAVDASCIVLVFEGKVLPCSSNLEQCDVKEGSVLYLGVLSYNDEMYQDDIAGSICDDGPAPPELGFAGSILVGGGNNNSSDQQKAK